MKKYLLFIALLISLTSNAQLVNVTKSPNSCPTPGQITGQMRNLSNTYPLAALDTLTDAGTLYLNIAYWNGSNLPVIMPVYQKGKISFVVKGLKIGGTPAGTVTIEESANGTSWAAVPNAVTADSVYTIVNQSAAQYKAYNYATKYTPYYRVKIVGSGTSTSSWLANWYCTQD